MSPLVPDRILSPLGDLPGAQHRYTISENEKYKILTLLSYLESFCCE